MSHPCDGHACDHCYLCDVVGVCCATVPSAAAVSGTRSRNDALREAVLQEARTCLSFGRLVRLDNAAHLVPSPASLALLAGPACSDQLFSTAILEQEAEHVLAPRRHQQ